jgi:hypothetical protein
VVVHIFSIAIVSNFCFSLPLRFDEEEYTLLNERTSAAARLHFLTELQKTQQTNEQNQDQTEHTIETDIEPKSIPLSIIEKHKSLKIVGINQEVLKDLYIKCEGVKDVINKCINYHSKTFLKMNMLLN